MLLFQMLLFYATLVEPAGTPPTLEYTYLNEILLEDMAYQLEIQNNFDGRIIGWEHKIDTYRNRLVYVEGCPSDSGSKIFKRFDLAYSTAATDLNREHRTHLYNRQAYYMASRDEYWVIEEMLTEYDELYYIYSQLYLLHSDDIVTRRMGLKTLKEKLGDKDYYTGNLPPPLPIRFYKQLGN